jgi:hypothetical protein
MAKDLEWTEAWEAAVRRAWGDPTYKARILSSDTATVIAALKEVGYTVDPSVKQLTFAPTHVALDPGANSSDSKDSFVVTVPFPSAPQGDLTHVFDQMSRRLAFLC